MDAKTARGRLRNIVSQEKLYSGRILNLRIDHVKFPSGDIKPREVVEHRPAAAILAVDAAENIYLVAQYRHAVDEVLYEIPAGIIEQGENAAEAAVRELQEEIGYKPGILMELNTLYTSPGFSDEEVILFYATELEQSELPQDDDEQIDVEKFSLAEIKELIEQGKIKDGKTMVAVYWYELQKTRENAEPTN